jgi:hypothetical protein
MRRSRRAGAVLAAGAALLLLAGEIAPPSAPPLYDSGPIVAEPYRYCKPPPGYTQTTPPSKVDHVLKLESGQSPAMAESTDEQPAQAQLLAPQNAFAVPPGVTSLHVVIACVGPPPVPPPGGRLDGNVYAVVVSAGTTPLPIRAGQQVTVVLRGPAGAPNPTLELFADGAWSTLDTQPLGNTAPDSYAANVSRLGDIALVVSNATPAPQSGGGSSLAVALVVAAAVLVAAATVLGTRRRSGGGAPRRRR